MSITIEEYNRKIKQVLISEEEIKSAVAKAGKYIDDLYDGKPILIVSILKGAFVFMADVLRAVTVPVEIDFMVAKSYYSGTISSGMVQITLDLSHDIKGYHVVILEDIVDTGRTLHDVYRLLKEREPASLHVITLLDKPERRVVEFTPDLSLFTIPDLFVIGYGMNDGGMAATQTKANVKKMIDGMYEIKPEVSVMIVSTMTPHSGSNWDHAPIQQQERQLESLAKQLRKDDKAVAVACVHSVSVAIQEHKTFNDYSGNNINHPNDWFYRVYAQTLLQTLIGYENMN